MKKQIDPLAKSIVIAVAIMFGTFLITRFLVGLKDLGQSFGVAIIWSELFAAPLLSGAVAGMMWAKLDLRTLPKLGYSGIVVGFTILLISITALEGIFCLLIISPLIFALFLVGVSLGAPLSKLRKGPRISLTGLVVILFAFDLSSSHHYASVVEDTVIVHASPDRVWKYVAEYEPITKPPTFWMFRLGFPTPKATTVSAFKTGASRKCIFSNGIVFDEVMSVYDSARELTFDITHSPPDPEILGHLTLQRGQFLLTPMPDGSTMLKGTSWYELHIFPAWYFDLWAQAITSNVHKMALEHIKDLAEREK